MENFDLAVIGAGPGGYVAAIHAAKNGMKVALVERGKVGGACYNVGCIPSKILLEHSKLVQEIERGKSWGIETSTVNINFPRLMQRKDAVIAELLANIEGFIANNQITFYRGEASMTQDLTVTVGTATFTAKDIILATGSKPFVPPFKGLETATYYTTDTFFDMKELPKQLTIIGGGVIAVEMAFSLAPLGTKVTMLNHSLDVLQTEEPDARPIIRERMTKLGIELVTDFQFDFFNGSEIHTSKGVYTYENLLFATGRRPNTEIAEKLGLDFDGRLIAVNEHLETSQPHIYAIGDLVGGYQLAHAASAEGLHVVEHILGQEPTTIDQTLIPRCVYTHPEIATFGLQEDQIDEAYMMMKIPIRTNPKALMEGNVNGFVKLLATKGEGCILGACVVGDGATEILNTILATKNAGGTAATLAQMIFPHPTISEHIGDVTKAVFGKAIHM
ncbi:acetoin dehydrogenase [Lysinibacillus contaminans]|uniref:Dihydrolipoyl dehydrogenase n=1 Tax=Lysinibacillus contaminans TaxID=1293441 RepID=A0ABR5K4U1_9BACI|nr:dihydrolipoyl dehydrogenase [Lysinibacillus contaminans]KOS69876.1 acetoin dehydrogenase [Lysinibacillus contaminans]